MKQVFALILLILSGLAASVLAQDVATQDAVKGTAGVNHGFARGTLSREFSTQALKAVSQMQGTMRRVEETIKRGIPFGEFLFENDLEQVNNSLQQAAILANGDDDASALKQMQLENSRLKEWIEWFSQAHRKLQTGEYYTSSSALDGDERFQNSVTCTQSLLRTLSTRKLSDDQACR